MLDDQKEKCIGDHQPAVTMLRIIAAGDPSSPKSTARNAL